MNHIYHSIWNDALGAWIAVSEIATGQGKRSSNRRKNPMTVSPLKDWQSSTPLLAAGLFLFSSASWALPTGDQLIAGQAIVNTPIAGQMQIDQSSQQAIINWQGFSIAPNEAVTIQQPNAQAALLNRIVGQDASQIQGQLHANGQVYLVNPNGVLFGKTAQVDVGGLIASTHNITNADFLNGVQHFTQDNATGTVSNQGTITTPDGGVVAFIGNQVSNDGTISTPKGTTALAAGKTIDLDFTGNGLIEVKVSEAALNAQITNKGAIQADGGRVVLSAKAAGQLIDTVINQAGIIKAQGLVERNGEIILDGGDSGTVQVSGTVDTSTNQGLNSSTTGGNITVKGAAIELANGANLNASGNTGGGAITIGDKQSTQQTTIAQGATVSTNTLDSGTAGTINVLANMNSGTVKVAGKLDASAPKNGNGGFIETSAAHVKIADSANVTTKANNGISGNWLIDPVDFTIAATGGDMTGAAVNAALLGSNFTIQSTTGAGGVNGDVNVNDIVTWAANTLTLNAQNNINISANMNASGAARLDLLFGQGALATNNTSSVITKAGASVSLPASTTNFTTKQGSNGVVKNYTVITSLGAQGSVTTTDLQGMSGNTNLNYALGANIDATATSGWNAGAGFLPVNIGLSGKFDGLGHTITGLTINRPTQNYVGLFGSVSSAGGGVSNIAILDGSVIGQNYVGGLVGFNQIGTINNAYATGSVTGIANIGGLVGFNQIGTINNAYATGSVSGTTNIGGLVGWTQGGTINNAYATGNVTGNDDVGGLVGWTQGGTINNAYATGSVSETTNIGGLVGWTQGGTINNAYATGSVSGTTNIGGLVGWNQAGTINNAFWDTITTGKNAAQGVGLNAGILNNVVGKTTAQMKQMATFSGAGWSIANTGGSTAVWRIYEGNSAPLLRSFLIPLQGGKTYDGTTSSGIVTAYINSITKASISPTSELIGTATLNASATNAGDYSMSSGLYSTQKGYDVLDTFTINKADLTVTANAVSRSYGAANPVFSGTVTGFVNGELQANVTTGTASYASLATNTSNVGNYLITGSGLTANFGNYIFTQAVSNATALSITPATLTYTANAASRLYGAANPIFSGTVTGFVNGENQATATTGLLDFSSLANNFSNVGSYPINGSGLTANFGNYNFVQAVINNTALSITPVTPVTPVSPATPVTPVTPVTPFNPEILSSQLTPLQTSTTFHPFSTAIDRSTKNSASTPDSDLSVSDVSNDFSSNTADSSFHQFLSQLGVVSNAFSSNVPSNAFSQSISKQEDNKKTIVPILQIKNSAGRVKHLELSANKQFLSLLMEDGSVRIWDFERGVQRTIVTGNKEKALTDISAVDDKGDSLLIASKAGIGVHDIISSVTDDKSAINEADINHFVTANDGSLLLMNVGTNKLSLWDSKLSKQRWSLDHERGVVNNLALSDDKHYGAVLSRQAGVYAMTKDNKAKPITDAVDIIDLATGKVIKALPNTGENIVYMNFKNNDTLLVGLASGKLLDWSMAAGSKKSAGEFTESVVAVDNSKEAYAYVAENGTVRIGNGQGHLHLSIQNKDNPITDAKLLEGGKKLLTVLASGDVALWDVESGKKLLRLFSTKQGWTVMDEFGRFDGSDEAMENFSWLAGEEEIPLDSFSENYYEPGLLTNVLQNRDYLNSNPDMVADGISLPPKVDVQLAEQSTGDKVALKLDVYDRGGGIDKIQLYQNGRLISNESAVVAEQSLQEEKGNHRVLTLNVTPNAGKNTLKVVASNDMGIENSSSEISFDGKTKAYQSAVRLMTVGISQYQESRLHLNYTVADAELIGETIKNNSNMIASKTLINEKATKPQILAELKELSQGVQQDVLVIYFAGHGMALGKEWYFLPHETKLKPTPEQISTYGVTATELSDIFKNSKIQHILLMVDACYSGAGLDAFSKLENGQRYLSRRLSRSLGITVIAAASKNQESFELKSLGHGLFTYLISQEIANKESDKSITAHGIAENITKTLPKFSKDMLGSSQEPAAYTRGNDFMLTDLLKGKK